MIKKLSGHHVRPQLGFCRTRANFGRPMSDDQLLFAALQHYESVAWCNKERARSGLDTCTVTASCIMCPSSTFCLILGLCFSFASSESKRIHSIAMATGVTTALKIAEERLKSFSWETNPPSTDIMR